MKKIYSILLSTVLTGMLFTLPVSAAETSYTDVASDSWYAEAVDYAVENGLFTGTSESMFDPDGTMTRGMFVTALGRMADVSAAAPDTSVFSDVSAGAYYAPYVAWAAENNIVNGMGNGTFEPDTVLDREQMCTIFVRYLQEYLHYDTSAYENSAATFADADQISSWAVESVSIAQAMGLVQGIEQDGVIYFSPNQSVTRAAGVTIFVRVDRTVSGSTTPEEPQEPETPDQEEPQNPNGSAETPGGGGGGGGGTADTPEQPSYTEEEIAEEAQVAGYLSNMCEKYPTLSYVATTDQPVQDCMNLLIECLNKALDERENGAFLSSDYVRNTYADEIEQFKSMYSALTENQKIQAQNVVGRMESEANIYIVLDYFGISTVNL